MKRTWRNKVFSVYWAGHIGLNRFRSTLCSRISLGWQGASVGKRFRTAGPCFFKLRQSGSVCIGNDVTWTADHRSNRVGLTGPVILETWGDGRIEIGDFSGGSSAVISARSRVTVGKHVLLGGNVRIFDHDFHSLDFRKRRNPAEDQPDCRTAPVVIGDDVFIGTNAVILKGVTIGDRAIIGAGSVVSCNVPAGEIWAGNPARCVRNAKKDP